MHDTMIKIAYFHFMGHSHSDSIIDTESKASAQPTEIGTGCTPTNSDYLMKNVYIPHLASEAMKEWKEPRC
jgi:hypothetical protein